MRNLCLLLRVRLDEMFRISKIRHRQEGWALLSELLHQLVLLSLYAVICAVIYNSAMILVRAKMAEALPVIGYVLAVAVTFITTVLKINEDFSGREDSEFLLSMPFYSAVQVFSLFIMVYVRNVLISAMVEVPLLIPFLGSGAAAGFSVVRWIIGLLMTCLPVNGIAVLIGMVIALSLVNSPKKNQIMSGIALVLMAAVVALLLLAADRIYLIASSYSASEGLTASQKLIYELTHNFKFCAYYQEGIVEGELTAFILFIFMSFIWYGAVLFLHTIAYQLAIIELRSPVTYGEKQLDEFSYKLTDVRTILFRKELQQFTRSKSYLISKSIGLILMVAVPLNFLIIGTAGLEFLTVFIPVFICAATALSCTSYCSMSMEGRRIWIMQAAAPDISEIARAKVRLNLCLTIPTVIISCVLFAAAFRLHAAAVLINLAVTLAFAVGSAIWGIMIDIKFADYDGETETLKMKQGKSFLLGFIPQLLLPLAAAAILVFAA